MQREVLSYRAQGLCWTSARTRPGLNTVKFLDRHLMIGKAKDGQRSVEAVNTYRPATITHRYSRTVIPAVGTNQEVHLLVLLTRPVHRWVGFFSSDRCRAIRSTSFRSTRRTIVPE